MFDGPQAAIAAAMAIRTAACAMGLQIYSGVHTGEVEQRHGDIAGLAVHIAARVLSAAAPGEVLVTRTVRDLVAGSGLTFADHGEHELKGVDEKWHLRGGLRTGIRDAVLSRRVRAVVLCWWAVQGLP